MIKPCGSAHATRAHCHVPRRLRRPPHRALPPASSLFAPLPPSPVFQPRLPVRLAPNTSLIASSLFSLTHAHVAFAIYCHRHRLHGELLVRGACPRLRKKRMYARIGMVALQVVQFPGSKSGSSGVSSAPAFCCTPLLVRGGSDLTCRRSAKSAAQAATATESSSTTSTTL
jgi:hypothetical protein